MALYVLMLTFVCNSEKDTMEENKEFLNQDNNYRTLMAFQKAECIYDVTYYFAHKFLNGYYGGNGSNGTGGSNGAK